MSATYSQKFVEYANEFSDILTDLRRRVLLCFGIFGLACLTGFFFSGPLIRTLLSLLELEGVQYVISSPFQLLSMSMDMALFIGIASVFPLVLVEIYEFTRPGLSKFERNLVARYVLTSVALFLLGFAYGLAVMYYATWAVAIFNGNLGLSNYWDISLFMSQMLFTSALLGVLFQFPLIVSALIRFGVVSREFFASKRRYVIAGAVIVVALLPPTDGLSLLVMAVPLVGLYELTLLLARMGGRREVRIARDNPVLGEITQ